MKKYISILLSFSILIVSGVLSADTLDTVKSRGKVRCGVNTALAGFSAPDSQGKWVGIDVDVCRAVATAIFNDPKKVEFVALSAQQRFTALQSGEIDLLSRNTTLTLQREVGLGLLFADVIYYDGQGFLVTKKSGIKSAKQLNRRTVCVQPGTTTELNLADFARNNKINLKPVVIEKFSDSVNAYIAGRCDAYTTDASGLAAIRTTVKDPDAHIILPEIISKEPLAPAVRQGDDKWYNIVNWTIRALVTAEELGIDSANVARIARSSNITQNAKRLLDSELAGQIGLTRSFAYNVISKIGNYGEIFEKNIGVNSPLKLERGLNNLWTNGGLQYAPPFR
ncbi:MAG: amino acid ABC transporter substrate-binding protein [SAR324 cluster bacterium]|nr:amino acid ABC transporter substrate-binding protein [SAR324 cluster bacterium]